MVKMSTMEFISSQNLILSPAAKNYKNENRTLKILLPLRIWGEHNEMVFCSYISLITSRFAFGLFYAYINI